MKRQIEILAPAGSYEGMKAAMNAGCDAVYIGGSSFGARAYANNLDEDTLLHAIDEAHIRDKNLYLTVNTLVKEKEMEHGLYQFLEKLYLQGLDAVIVQDVGVMHFIHHHFPKLPIHASTQTTLTMAQGANLLKDYGVTRLVTARELSFKEIRTIRENTDMEIETFVHGALCYCYSGQCLMSSMIGGRSGNRGRCAQPCRMPYQFFLEGKQLSSNQDKYLLSPKDINTVSMIPDLVEAGIDSFKIEGRMKRPEYAAVVSYMYRKYVDLYFDIGKEAYIDYIQGRDFTRDMIQLQDIFNRGGFSKGYGKTYNGKTMMSLNRPNHSGVYVGEVTSVKGSQVSITLKESINAQDVLEIRDREEEGYEFTVKDSAEQGEILTTNVGRRPIPNKKETIKQGLKKQEIRSLEARNRDTKTNWSPEPVIHIGDMVYRTKNNALLEQIASDFMEKDLKQGITGLLEARLGEKLKLTLTYQDCTVTAFHDRVQEALKQPMTEERLLAPVAKIGDTLYYFEELKAIADQNIFVPVSWLNEIRRDAILLLMDEIRRGYRRSIHENNGVNKDISKKNIVDIKKEQATNLSKYESNTTYGACVALQTKEQFDVALTYEKITSIYGDYDTFEHSEIIPMSKTAKRAGKDFYLVLPPICRLSVYEKLKKDIVSFYEQESIKGFVVKNFEEISLLQSLGKDEKQHKEIILNFNMYTYNREAKVFWSEMGVTRFTAPVELNYQELKKLGVLDCDLIVYGYLPLMISAQCLYESIDGCSKCKAGVKNKTGYLVDRLGKKFYVQTNCSGCYNTIYNGQCISLLKQALEVGVLRPRNIRLDFTLETKEEMRKALSAFVDVYFHDIEASLEVENVTTGHFKRGVE